MQDTEENRWLLLDMARAMGGYGYDEMWWADVYEPDDLEYSAPDLYEAFSEPPRPYGRGFRAFRRDDCFRHGYMTSYEVTPRFRGLLHAHVVLPVGRLAWPGDI